MLVTLTLTADELMKHYSVEKSIVGIMTSLQEPI